MRKLQELFRDENDQPIMDTKVTLKILDIPTEPTKFTTTSGKEVEAYIATFEKDGEEYSWELKKDKLDMIFTKKYKDGNISWQAKAGDLINIWYATSKSVGGRSYYASEPSDGTAPKAVPASTGEASEAPSKPKFAKVGYSGPARSAAADTKWDGTPRQGNFRAGLAGILQAILSNPVVNPFEQSQVEAAKEVAEDLMLWVRKRSTEVEAVIED